MSSLDWQTSSYMTLCAVSGVALGWLARSKNFQRVSLRTLANKDVTVPHKMVIVVRKDLEMSAGKVATQSAHAAVSAVAKAQANHDKHLDVWFAQGQPKIVLACNKESTIDALYKQAVGLDLNATAVRDAGKTQLTPGTKTSLAIGPAPAKLIDKVTSHLKLF